MGATGSRPGGGDSSRVVGSSDATVTAMRSETPEFDQRIARMGELVDPCHAEMIVLTQCFNEHGRENKEACAAARVAMQDCHQRREASLKAIDGSCKVPQTAYEACMQASATDPSRCIELLDTFLVCAEAATGNGR